MSVKSCLKRCGPALLLTLALLSLPGLAQAIQVEVSWTYEAAPEGPQIKGFRIYYGAATQLPIKNPQGEAKPYDKVIQLEDPQARKYSFDLQARGRQYFRMTSWGLDEAGKLLESAFSPTEVTIQVKPNAPRDVKIMK